MKGIEGLKVFCDDLASDDPAPGGGTASAAAGAMAASLLSMVCGITLKSKKHEEHWPRLASLRRRSEDLRSLLLKHADLDAIMYLVVVRKARARRESPDDKKVSAEYADAIRKAIEVPMNTAELCIGVLKLADDVAVLGTKSAASDVEVARLLAAAGADGAVANVMINLPYCADAVYVAKAKERAEVLAKEKAGLVA